MSAISGVSTTSVYPSKALQNIGRASPVRGNQNSQRQAAFEQDLTQAGLSANVSPDDLLKSIQSSIKAAISDPSNSGKDLLQVIQSAVQKTLEKNGVDTEKLTSLLQSQSADAIDGQQVGEHPPGPAPQQGPPPSERHKHGGSLVDATDPNIVASDTDNGVEETKKHRDKRTVQDSKSATASNGDASIPVDLPAQFKRLIADLIKSLPSGSALDVQA